MKDHFYVEWDLNSSIFVPRFIGVWEGTPFRYYHRDPMVALCGVRLMAARAKAKGTVAEW